MKTCSVEGCDRPSKFLGWCHPHYTRSRREGWPKPEKVKPKPLPCTHDNCGRTAIAKGLCNTHYQQIWRAENREASNGYTRNWQSQNREHTRRRSSEWRKKNPERWVEIYSENNWENRFVKRLAKHGWRESQWRALIAFQNNACAICARAIDADDRFTHVDHCHTNGFVRGALCHWCNTRLGTYEKHMRPDGALYPRYDRYLNAPPAIQFLQKADNDNG